MFRRKKHSAFGTRSKPPATEAKWQDSDQPLFSDQNEDSMSKSKSSFVKKFFIFSFLFFSAALAFGFLMFYQGSNVISTDNVQVSISGPNAVAGGEEFPMDISITNKNNASLKSAVLIIEYPDGTKSTSDITENLQREHKDLGEVLSGATIHTIVKAVFFGREGSQKDVKVTVEYGIKGSNAKFHKDLTYAVLLSSSPLVMTVESVKEVTSGQQITFKINVVSNSTNVIKNVLVRASYPFGFSFGKATPTANHSNSGWALGDLPPGGVRTITLVGNVEGQDNEERNFKFEIGTSGAKDDAVISTTFLSSLQAITISKPFLGLTLSLNGDDSKEVVVSKNRTVRAEIAWVNNLDTSVSNAVIVAKLSGVIDPASVSAEGGFYRSSDNTITWNKSTLQNLSLLNPGDNGKIGFTFRSQNFGTQIRNPQMAITVDVRGDRSGDSSGSSDITSATSKVVKISSDLNLISRAVYYSGPFKNTGPIPAQANKETSYTVTWSVVNSSSGVSNAKVKAVLPTYMKWTGIISPSGESVAWNSDTHEVTWDVGDVSANTGIGSSPRQVSFQIIFLASASQVGTTPLLLGQATLTGIDNFSNITLTSQKNELTTNLISDPSFQPQDQNVVQ